MKTIYEQNEKFSKEVEMEKRKNFGAEEYNDWKKFNKLDQAEEEEKSW